MAWVEQVLSDWTPTITQSGSVSITINYATYSIIGNIVVARMKVTCTGAGTGNNAIVIAGLPSGARPVDVGIAASMGTGVIFDSGTGYYVGTLLAIGATDYRIVAHGLANYVGITPNFALANNDIISFQAAFEVV